MIDKDVKARNGSITRKFIIVDHNYTWHPLISTLTVLVNLHILFYLKSISCKFVDGLHDWGRNLKFSNQFCSIYLHVLLNMSNFS